MEDWKKRALELRDAGYSSRRIGKAVGKGKSTINTFFKAHGLAPIKPVIPTARILLLDVETAPLLANVWGMFKQNVGLNQLEAHSYMLTWAAKWLGEDGVMAASLPDYPGYEIGSEDDKALVSDLRDLMDQADIIIAHNLRGFDKKVINTRILINGIKPPKPYKTIDTLDIAKSQFKFTSNKLDGIAIQLGLQRKLATGGFELWRGCMTGNPDSWNKMVDYNIQDVLVLEEVYLKLRAWDNRHPNVAIYGENDRIRCTCCGSDKLTPTDGMAYTGVSAFAVWSCDDCGKYVRSRKNTLSKDKSANILANIV